MKKILACLLLLALLTAPMLAAVTAADTDTFTDVVILSTTDMHGKCWDENILTGAAEHNNMLRVSTAVSQFRAEYGVENTLIIDNGDLFQGTPVSQVQLLQRAAGQSESPLAMALCLAEIGYDAFVLGNHEFNYDWNTMRETYAWLEKNGVPVLAANVCHDGSDPAHPAGENVFTPYITKTVLVNGHPHKIGILGFENCDITRWDLPSNYPGLQFVHPGNENFSMADEARPYIAAMQEEGCEFIILSYHGGIGDTDLPLSFGLNSESQGKRIIEENEGIAMAILGHDHSFGYSNTFTADRAQNEVLVVNGGSQRLTKSVFRFSEDGDGKLQWSVLDSASLDLGTFAVDEDLQALIRPYAETAGNVVEQPAGVAGGTWDNSRDFYTQQTDSIDLINKAMIVEGTVYLQEKFGESGAAALAAAGLDHLEVDMAMTTVTTSGYIVQPGGISVKDIYRLYRYANDMLILPMYGRDIRAVMEENASERLTARVFNGQAYYYSIGDKNTHLLFGGLNFRYDMSQPAGQRVQIDGFSNGRSFEDDRLYLAAVNNYILGNERCGLRIFTDSDAIWSQSDDGNGGTIQDVIVTYLTDTTAANGAVTPDDFTWRWSVGYSADPKALPPYEGPVVAELAEKPEDGHTYILYHEAQGCTLTDRSTGGGLGTAVIHAYGSHLVDTLPAEALRFTAHVSEDGLLSLTDERGRFLASGTGGGLMLVKTPAEGNLHLWRLEPANGGWYLVNEGDDGQALEYYSGKFTMYHFEASGLYLFNFYEIGA